MRAAWWTFPQTVAPFLGRLLLATFVATPYIFFLAMLLFSLPGRLRAFRIEIDWIAPCAERLRVVQTQLARGIVPSCAEMTCPVTGAHYVVRRKGRSLELFCPGIHRTMTVLWEGLNQAGVTAHPIRGVAVHERVQLRLDAAGRITKLRPYP